jgi:hypothetical protein
MPAGWWIRRPDRLIVSACLSDRAVRCMFGIVEELNGYVVWIGLLAAARGVERCAGEVGQVGDGQDRHLAGSRQSG